ncbi:JAB domain-containing protein [Pedobacter xixiisoli]|uniref:RadC-like JAB domain-containing protein n=1 Tax=Pedobacter xixiisoli TaxID=1476464 RepID=A0A285ZRF3_9SPHI|nr:JAB domain-containing protein [Pedobacter xixiisoli]SOD12246.1 RadC-like JAB domain-containing protein [Pedobacter xixiisoli]
MEQNEIFRVAEVQLSYKPHFRAQERPQISTSEQAYQVLLNNWDMKLINYIEQAKMILLNSNNRVLGIVNLSTGGSASTVLDTKILFTIALKATATSIILCHNHPSGNLRPSSEDIRITEKIKQGGKLLDIAVHDHLIISENGYLSMADEAYM